MAVERDIIYMGLLRPAKILGLPLMAAAVWFISACLVFMWSESFWGMAAGAATWPLLYALSQWDAHFFDVIATTTKNFGVAKNKRIWGGHSYEP